mmetsp:Transcript_18891/g.46380  ORF Transcript_18891/g.46380 Transcript_18891/m.46380 type:complete len:247 (+) Transcript_18891:1107-1847(+)
MFGSGPFAPRSSPNPRYLFINSAFAVFVTFVRLFNLSVCLFQLLGFLSWCGLLRTSPRPCSLSSRIRRPHVLHPVLAPDCLFWRANNVLLLVKHFELAVLCISFQVPPVSRFSNHAPTFCSPVRYVPCIHGLKRALSHPLKSPFPGDTLLASSLAAGGTAFRFATVDGLGRSRALGASGVRSGFSAGTACSNASFCPSGCTAAGAESSRPEGPVVQILAPLATKGFFRTLPRTPCLCLICTPAAAS